MFWKPCQRIIFITCACLAVSIDLSRSVLVQAQQCVMRYSTPPAQRTFRVGVLANRGYDTALNEFNKTFTTYLTAQAGARFDPPIAFEMVPIPVRNALDDMLQQDFVFSNPSMTSCVESEVGASSLVTKIARRSVNGQEHSLAEFGGVIFTRADNNQVNEMVDLANQTLAMLSIAGLGSGQMQFREMQKAGLHHLQAPRQIIFTGSQYKVVDTVMLGQADVGFVRTDQLERSVDPTTGEPLDLSNIKIIAESVRTLSTGDAFPFVSSTPLYPEWNVLSLPHVPHEVTQAVQEALLAMKDYASVGQNLLTCLEQRNCTTSDKVCLDECFVQADFDKLHDCDTTPDHAFLASDALADAKTTGFRPTLSYMTLRTMQDEISFIHPSDNSTSGMRCVRPVDIQDAVVCPPGHYKQSYENIQNGCEQAGLDCFGYPCLCKPCVEAFAVQFSPLDRLRPNESIFKKGCGKFDICGRVEQEGTIHFQAIDNKARQSVTFTMIVFVGETSKEYELSKTGETSYEVTYTASSTPVGLVVVQVFADGVQIEESPFRLKVTQRDCVAATQDSHRTPDKFGSCICDSDTIEMGDRCVPIKIFIFCGLAIFLLFVGIFLYWFVQKKRREADALWRVDPNEVLIFEPERVLGEGRFGKVLLAEFRGTRVAVKKILPSKSNKPVPPENVAPSPGLTSLNAGSGCASFQTGAGVDDIENQLARYLDKNSRHSDQNSGKPSVNGATEDNTDKADFGMLSAGFNSAVVTVVSQNLGNSQKGDSSSKKRGSRGTWSKTSDSQIRQDFIEEMRQVSRLRHPCITTVMGAVVSKGSEPMLILEYMQLGSLHSLLHNKSMVVEDEQLLHILQDIAQGVRFLHTASPQVIHGDLKSRNILVDSKLNAKVADFGFSKYKKARRTGTPYWMAPELLRGEACNDTRTDIYSMGIVLYEVFSRQDPYAGEDYRKVLQLVMDKNVRKRPSIPRNCPPVLKRLIKKCLAESPNKRPTADEIDNAIRGVSIESMGDTTTTTNKSADEILLQLFPKHVAEALKDGRKYEPESHDCATIFFSDIVGYTKIASTLTPEKVSDLLDRLYTGLDALCDRYHVFKIETVGDAFMAVTNVAEDQSDSHAKIMADFSQAAIEVASETLIDVETPSLGSVELRIGINSGPVVTNVCGTRNQRFSVIGDAVNTASRMESSGFPGQIQVSGYTASLLRTQAPGMVLLPRGRITVKGKGEMNTYFVRPRDMGALLTMARTSRHQSRRSMTRADTVSESTASSSNHSRGVLDLSIIKESHEEKSQGSGSNKSLSIGVERAAAALGRRYNRVN